MAATSPLTPAERRRAFDASAPTTRTRLAPIRRHENPDALTAVQKWNLTFVDVLQQVLLEPDADNAGITKFTRVARSLVDEAMAGSAEHIKIMLDRLEGKPAQTIHHDGQVQLSWAELVKKAVEVTSYRVLSDEEEMSG